ncbi:MAG: Methionyl-tRNA formyltransferase [Candidatus Omnitrophica bacterium]|nr:Methionyl-tRNA formyltransferase [Candidatus Omnitrophota bacterium]
MRVVFLGTSPFALPSLERLVRDGYAPELVVTQPDKPRGRDRRPTPTPVGAWALEHGLKLERCDRSGLPELTRRLRASPPDALVVIAYGAILPQELLDAPRLMPINVHASLLPAWRGAAPIHRSILAGDRRTGVSIMRMTRGLDEGPVLDQRAIDIAPAEDLRSLETRLARLGADALMDTLRLLGSGRAPLETPQDASKATIARKIVKEDARMDWALDASELERRVRALSVWPGCETRLGGRRFLVHDAVREDGAQGGPPGRILGLDRAGRLRVGCGRGVLALGRLQAEGRPAVPASEWVNGYRVEPGTSFDSP